MQSHGPKRVYTPQSLEFWFEKLAEEWEPHFSTPQLEAGHRLYREGDVRELELTDHDAIVHRRVDKRDEYAVIEWSGGKLAVRSSSTDLDVARALAVAGLHEIEELVADEISPLPGDGPAEAPEPHGHSNGRSHGNGNGSAPGEPLARPSGPRPAPTG